MIRINTTMSGLDMFRINVKSVAVLPIESFDTLLNNNVRISIMDMLSKGPMTVTSLAQELGILKGVVHRHVKALEDFGWIRQLSDEEVKVVGLSREANRIYYVPTAMVYLGFKLEINEHGMKIIIPTNYGAFIDIRGRKFILVTPTYSNHDCKNSCPSHEACLDWIKRIGKQFHVSIDYDDASKALMHLYTQLILREFKINIVNNVIMLDSPRLNSIFIRHSNLAL
ncbi:ArsR/SmtB family transcription factor [Vulcanisaeta sp. JCM 14467]|uniref:ArsR/SmtB family transcription factor n=1 Tax=Vulcanisaeta sp. JCM 14467 TaxID=1295370 RepID=UPI0006D27DA6|nr:winged helix-turn-helix domain-containing protein [Vulcanisaeta sp. JCM 14467]